MSPSGLFRHLGVDLPFKRLVRGTRFQKRKKILDPRPLSLSLPECFLAEATRRVQKKSCQSGRRNLPRTGTLGFPHRHFGQRELFQLDLWDYPKVYMDSVVASRWILRNTASSRLTLSSAISSTLTLNLCGRDLSDRQQR